jgi:hypothetical protein
MTDFSISKTSGTYSPSSQKSTSTESIDGSNKTSSDEASQESPLIDNRSSQATFPVDYSGIDTNIPSKIEDIKWPTKDQHQHLDPHLDINVILGEVSKQVADHRDLAHSTYLGDSPKLIEDVEVAVTEFEAIQNRKAVVPVLKAYRAVEESSAGHYVRYGQRETDVNEKHGKIDWPSAGLFTTKTAGLYLFLFDGLAYWTIPTKFTLRVNGIDKAVSMIVEDDQHEEVAARHVIKALLSLDHGDKVGVHVVTGKLMFSNAGTRKAVEINNSTRLTGILLAH